MAMKTKGLLFLSFITFLVGINAVQAQQVFQGVRGTNQQALQRFASDLRLRQEANYNKAQQLAKKRGLLISQTYQDGSIITLKGFDDLGMLTYDVTYSNSRAAATTATSQVWPGGVSGLNLSGSSSALIGKIGIWDGPVRLTHQELKGRVEQMDGSFRFNDHGTHVAGTMIASGIYGEAKGMAHRAGKLKAWNFQLAGATANMAANAAELLVSNHSYGTVAGWYRNFARRGTDTDPVWEWWGSLAISPVNPSNPANDWKFGFYTNDTKVWDSIAYNAPYYLIVKAAGNNRSQNGPAVGQPYWRRNDAGTGWQLEAARPEGISSNDAYDILPTTSTAKNILTVGAVEPIANGYKQVSDVKISTFSSWGPTDDGRIKPDIVGNGVGVLSSTAANDSSYSSYNGTSMASPNVAGSLFLLQEHYSNLHNGKFMLSSTLKAVALHTADEAGRPGPDYVYGWGLLNTGKAANVITNAGKHHIIEENLLKQDSSYTFQVTASGHGPLVATICWTDPAGEVHAVDAQHLNNRTPKLVNDLDMRIADGAATFSPWILDPANPAANASTGDNFRDNVEQVLISNTVPGKVYTITISHKGTLRFGAQPYSLVVSGVGGQAYCSSAPASDAGARIENVTFAGINNSTASGCSTYSDFTQLSAVAQVGQSVPLSIKTGSCSTGADKAIKVFVDWNKDGDFEEADEQVAAATLLNGNNDFTAAVQVPVHTKAGEIVRMRIVLVETKDIASVQACGSYAKGETQDYTIKIVSSGKDVGVQALLSPEQGICATTSYSGVTLRLRNHGAEAQTGFPVRVAVKEDGVVVTTFNSTYTASLAAYADASFTVPGTLTFRSGKTYTFICNTSLDQDANPGNDTLQTIITIGDPAPAPKASGSSCGSGPIALQAEGEGTIYWYDAPTGGNLLTVGSKTTIVSPTANNTYYAGINDFSGKLGRSLDVNLGVSYTATITEGVKISAKVPLLIESIKARTTGAGTMTFALQDMNGVILATREVEILSNSPTNTGSGAEILLGLAVPAAGQYKLVITSFTGTLRGVLDMSESGVGFPFSIPHVVSITGSTAINDNYYFYMFDVKVKALGCPGAGRTEVIPVSLGEFNATITAEGPTSFCDGESVVLHANWEEGLQYQWYRNGAEIQGANQVSFTALSTAAVWLTMPEKSYYTVRVTYPNGCYKFSEPTTVTVNPVPKTPVITRNGNMLRSSSKSGNKWFRNGLLIEHANADSLWVTLNGEYTVQVELNGCKSELSNKEIFLLDALEVSMYPNPVSEVLTIDFASAKQAESVSGIIYAAQGAEIMKVNFAGADGKLGAQVNVSHFKPGVYFLQVRSSNSVHTKRFIKQ